MSNILSQEEIDTLLGGLTEGEVATDASAAIAPADLQKFDFFSQARIVRGGMPTLEIIHDRFARLLRTSLTQIVRRPVDVSVLSTTELKLGEFTRSLPAPSSLHILTLDPLKGRGLLVLPGKIIYTLIELFFGGSVTDTVKSAAQDFTIIERRIISRLTSVFDKTYSDAWLPVYTLEVASSDSETNAQFLNIGQASDTVTAVDYEIIIDDAKCGLSICLPSPTLEPIREILKGSVISDSMDAENVWSGRMESLLNQAVVEIRARLGSASISILDLKNLKVGDIIQLEEDFEHPVELLVEGETKFWGTVGARKSSRAIQITGFRDKERKFSHD